MKTKNIIISAFAGFSVLMLVIFMYRFINRQNTTYQAVVSLDKIHILYFQFENPITIVVPGVPQEKVIVKCAEVPVKTLGGTKYAIPVTDGNLMDKMVHLSVFVLNNGKEELIQTYKYWVVRTAPPITFFANHSEGMITAQEANNCDSLNITAPGFYYDDFNYKVAKFKFIITNKEKRNIVDRTGNKLYNEKSE